MTQPFVRNYQYNLIRRNADRLLKAWKTASDPKVIEAVQYSVLTTILEAFPDVTPQQKQVLERVTAIRTSEELEACMLEMRSYLTEFPPVTEGQLKKLFPKVKKLKMPDLAAIDFRSVTYLSWNDPGTNKKYLVYDLGGQIVGIEGSYTPLNRVGLCFVCHRHEETALFSAVAKSRPANASPEYYKAYGNYICANADACNRSITDVAALEKFIRDVT